MNIAIITPGGITNFGERAIMLGTIYQLYAMYPDEKICIYGYQDLKKEDPHLYEEIRKYKVEFKSPVIQGTGRLSRVLHAIGLLFIPVLFMSNENYTYLKNAKVYSKGQESFTQDYGFIHFIDSFLEPLLVSRINKDVVLYGHSIGPIYKYKTIVSWAVRRFSHVYVRDSRSKKLLLDFGYDKNKVTQIKDLAYKAVADYDLGPSRKSKQYYLIVPNAAICRTENETDVYINNLKAIIEKLLQEKKSVYIGSSVTTKDWNNDYALCEILKGMYPKLEVKYYTQLYDFLIDVRDAHKVISSRLHPLIMATGLNTDVVALSRSHKVKGLLGDLNLASEIIDPFVKINSQKIVQIP